MKTSSKISLVMILAALVTFVGFGQERLWAEPTCCDNEPPQCTAFSVCFDDGFCWEGNKCYATYGSCHWLPC